jgi:ABC-type multidrug transport system ATPase subunit
MGKSAVIETQDLTKRYETTTVVDKLSFSIHQGEIFGFLGPNGSGKTTTLLMLLGLTEAGSTPPKRQSRSNGSWATSRRISASTRI